MTDGAMNMRSEGEVYMLVQRNSKFPDNRRMGKIGKSAAMSAKSGFTNCSRVQRQINWFFDGLSRKRLLDVQVSRNPKAWLVTKTSAKKQLLLCTDE